jgi:hypothetical protein
VINISFVLGKVGLKKSIFMAVPLLIIFSGNNLYLFMGNLCPDGKSNLNVLSKAIGNMLIN